MNAIVSVARDWGIGCDGNLLIHNKADMKYFVEHTLGCTIIMGRRTFEGFPNGPLKGRRNIVITRDSSWTHEGVEVVSSPAAARALVASEPGEKVWLIGGASVYKEMLSDCNCAYVTKHDIVLPADSYFPNLDADPAWHVADVEKGGVTPEGVAFEFVVYKQER